jgi:hypothetical protein
MFRNHKGSTLIVVILVISFLLAIGIAVLTVTSSGTAVSGSMRNQEMAFNAAEAGFEAARAAIQTAISNGTWTDFGDHYLDLPTGFDIPFIAGAVNPVYFRRHTDEEVLTMIAPYGTDPTKVIYYNQPFVQDTSGNDDVRYTYTVFLVNDEAGGGTVDPTDSLMVCIGVVRAGTKILATARLEIVLENQSVGTNP